MGLVAQRFGLSAVFLSLGIVMTATAGLVCWFGSVTGAWSNRTDVPKVK
jgi:hypothetical protein